MCRPIYTYNKTGGTWSWVESAEKHSSSEYLLRSDVLTIPANLLLPYTQSGLQKWAYPKEWMRLEDINADWAKNGEQAILPVFKVLILQSHKEAKENHEDPNSA